MLSYKTSDKGAIQASCNSDPEKKITKLADSEIASSGQEEYRYEEIDNER